MTITTKRMCAALIALGMLGLGSGFAGTTNGTLSLSENFEGLSTNVLINTLGAWYSSANDASMVTNLGSTYTYSPSCGKSITDTGSKVLALNTGGDMLSNVFGNGTSLGLDMSAGKVFLDTMVQFVPGDLPTACTSSDTGIKLAVFVYTNSTTGSQDLMIYGGTLNPSTGNLLTNVIVDTGIAISPTDWHRLTVTFDATANQAGPSGWPAVQMFQVKLDNVVVTNTGGYAFNDGWKTAWGPGGSNPLPTPSSTGSWFRSATATGSAAWSLNAIAFQGTGLIDDLVLTQTDPLPGSFVVTQTIGANVTANPSATSITVAAGGTTSIVYTAAQWYRLNAVSKNGSQQNSGREKIWTNTFTSAGTSVAADATAATYTEVGLASDALLTFAKTYYGSGPESAALANSQLAFDCAHSLIPTAGTWCTLSQSAVANGTATPSDSAIYLLSGSTTSIVYQANGWYRMGSLTTNSVTVDAATGAAIYTQTFASVASDIAVTGVFAAATYTDVGGNVASADLLAFAKTTWGMTESAAKNNSQLARDFANSLNPNLTWWQITESPDGHSAASPAAAFFIQNGQSTTIVYSASAWFRLNSVTINNGAKVNAGGEASYPVALNSVGADKALASTTIAATYTDVGGNVTSAALLAYAERYYPTSESDAANNTHLAAEYLLGQDPTVSYSAPTLTISSLTVVGSSISVVVNLAGEVLPTTINGTLKLKGSTDLTTWNDVGTAFITGATFGSDGNSAAIPFTDTNANSFYKAQIVP